MYFPDIRKPSLDFGEDFPDNTITSVSETGYRQTRARTTRMPAIFNLRWTALSDADYQSLIQFWRTEVRGTSGIFTWEHPKWGTFHTVRFVEKPEFRLTEFGWNVSCSLEEV